MCNLVEWSFKPSFFEFQMLSVLVFKILLTDLIGITGITGVE